MAQSAPIRYTKLIEKLIRNFQRRTPLRTGSLVITMFGDCIAPRGGVVWLGSLIEALAPLGISHRLVRTAVYRLCQDGILDNEQVGRRSYYSLTPSGRRSFIEATDRIYAETDHPWDGEWDLIITSQLSTDERNTLRKDLQWLGFRSLGSDLLAHPIADQGLLHSHLQSLSCAHKVVLMRAQLPAGPIENNLLNLVTATWQLEDLEAAYDEFLSLFRPILNSLSTLDQLKEADAFYLRTFLVHEYRKILLRDPALPAQLLPPRWKGHTAYQLARELYRSIAIPSERFVDMTFRNQIGQLPTASNQFSNRFGGLV